MTGLNLETFLRILRADLGAWASLGVVGLILAVMTWTSWGSRRALRKCLFLSIAAHVGLIVYGGSSAEVRKALRLDPTSNATLRADRPVRITPVVAERSATGPDGRPKPKVADWDLDRGPPWPWSSPSRPVAPPTSDPTPSPVRDEPLAMTTPSVSPEVRAPSPVQAPAAGAGAQGDRAAERGPGGSLGGRVSPIVVGASAAARRASGPPAAFGRPGPTRPQPDPDGPRPLRASGPAIARPAEGRPLGALGSRSRPRRGAVDPVPVDRPGDRDRDRRPRPRPRRCRSPRRPTPSPAPRRSAGRRGRDARGSRPGDRPGPESAGRRRGPRGPGEGHPVRGLRASPACRGRRLRRSLSDVPPVYRSRLDPNRTVLAQRAGASVASEQAVERALDWLARHQDSADGRWDGGTAKFRDGSNAPDDDSFTIHCPAGEVCFGECYYWEADTALTGLSLLAYLGAGYTHLDGKYAPVVAKGLEFLVRSQKPTATSEGRAWPWACTATRWRPWPFARPTP